MRKKIATLVAVLKKDCDFGRCSERGRRRDIKKFLLYYDCDYDRGICKTVRILLQKAWFCLFHIMFIQFFFYYIFDVVELRIL